MTMTPADARKNGVRRLAGSALTWEESTAAPQASATPSNSENEIKTAAKVLRIDRPFDLFDSIDICSADPAIIQSWPEFASILTQDQWAIWHAVYVRDVDHPEALAKQLGRPLRDISIEYETLLWTIRDRHAHCIRHKVGRFANKHLAHLTFEKIAEMQERMKFTIALPDLDSRMTEAERRVAAKYVETFNFTETAKMLKLPETSVRRLWTRIQKHACALHEAASQGRGSKALLELSGAVHNSGESAADDKTAAAITRDILNSEGKNIGGRIIGSRNTSPRSFERAGKLRSTRGGYDPDTNGGQVGEEDDYREESTPE